MMAGSFAWFAHCCMATHSSTLAWKIPWMEEPGGLQSMGVSKSWTWLSDFTFTFHFHALEKEMATHSSVLVWRIPGMVEPGGLPSMGVTQNWSRLKRLSSRSSSLLVWTCEILFYWTDCNPLLLLFISMVKLSKIWPVDSCVLLAVPVILSLSLFFWGCAGSLLQHVGFSSCSAQA